MQLPRPARLQHKRFKSFDITVLLLLLSGVLCAVQQDRTVCGEVRRKGFGGDVAEYNLSFWFHHFASLYNDKERCQSPTAVVRYCVILLSPHPLLFEKRIVLGQVPFRGRRRERKSGIQKETQKGEELPRIEVNENNTKCRS